MSNPSEVMRILAEEYGIRSERELDEAIKRLGFINIGPFCMKPEKKEEEKAS